MPLNVGARVNHYEISGLLGAGGMGEVYRARDTRLDRNVALKFLPEAFASDPERRARFAREAKTLAALNHPHIAQIHGFEESGGTSALVMELVEGEDLSARLRRGAIPFDEALAMARQIADALATAHDSGIIHRDLKPGNIKLRDDGTVKVLDFGLAKALESGSSSVDGQSGSDTSNSPTITSPAMTLRGVILGTAAYMAPEQAKGRAVDRRADIWAFGCVFYEMLTGRRAFGGEDVSDTIASVLKSDVDWTGVPPAAQRLIRKCLEKDPRRRLQDIRDAWDLLDDGPQPTTAVPSRARWLPWAIAGALFVATATMGVMQFTQAPPVAASVRFQLTPPPNHQFDIYLSLSPDARRIAFTAADTESRTVSLWLRDLDSVEARRLPGTEGASSPFWSPDGRFLAFGVGRVLKKVEISSGVEQTVTVAPSNVGVGAWNRDGVIVFGTRGAGPMHRVAAAGGPSVVLTAIGTDGFGGTHAFPYFLPDDRRFLYFVNAARAEDVGVYVGSIDLTPATQIRGRVVAASHGPVFITHSTAGSRLLFTRNATLMAQPFDPVQARVIGETEVIAERVGSSGAYSYFSATDEALIFRTGRASQPNAAQLAWVDRKGVSITKLGEPMPLSMGANSIAIAPDGRQVAIMRMETPSPDLWLLELTRGVGTRLTFDDAPDIGPIWSPDGARLAFRSNRLSAGELYETDIGAAKETPFLRNGDANVPMDWSRDGRFILFGRLTPNNGSDLWAWSVDRKQATALLETPFAEVNARFSPDGRWVSYASTESGRSEIYIRPFSVSDGVPSLGRKWRVSTDGGDLAKWRSDGRELIFRDRREDFVSVQVTAQGSELTTSLPQRLFARPRGATSWDMSPDAQRFLLAIQLAMETSSSDPATVVLNWQPR